MFRDNYFFKIYSMAKLNLDTNLVNFHQWTCMDVYVQYLHAVGIVWYATWQVNFRTTQKHNRYWNKRVNIK